MMQPRRMQPPPGPPIQWGSVGWTDDGGTFLDLADASNDGSNLVRVTLYAGRAPTDAIDHTQAQGQPILCRLADGVAMPSRGDKVIVAIPHPWGQVPGGAVIIAKCSNNPSAQANLGAGELVIQTPGSPAQIMIRANGTIVMRTADKDGNNTTLTLAPNSFKIIDPAFMIVADTTGIRFRHAVSGALLKLGGMSGAPAPLSAFGSMVHIKASQIRVDGQQVLLGPWLNGGAFYQPVITSPNPSDTGLQPVTLTGISCTGVKVSLP